MKNKTIPKTVILRNVTFINGYVPLAHKQIKSRFDLLLTKESLENNCGKLLNNNYKRYTLNENEKLIKLYLCKHEELEAAKSFIMEEEKELYERVQYCEEDYAEVNCKPYLFNILKED